MKKTRLVWILTGLVVLVTVVLILFLPNPHDLLVGKAKVEQLPEGQDILGNAWTEIQSVQKGDAFLYIVEVLYNPSQVSGVDRDSLDTAVNLEPFEVRNIEEKEFNLDSGARVYQRQYEIQLMNGETEHLYEFPTIVVLYELRYADGFAETSVMPEPIYVSTRLQEGMYEMISALGQGYDPLRPLEGKIEDVSQNRLPWILWILGGFLVALTVVDLRLRVIPQWKEQEREVKKTKMSEALRQAYRSLDEKAAIGAEPKGLLYQMDYILKIVLVQRENAGWLEEPNLDLVSDEIKASVISLFEKCQNAYGIEEIKQKDVDEALKELKKILSFYFEGEMEEWKA